MTKRIALHAFALTCLASAAVGSTAAAQDYNHVPGWANTYNHSHKGGEGRSELPGESALMAQLRQMGPEARCTLDAIEQPDRNVIVNRYRSNVRRSNEREALRIAQSQVAEHYRRLRTLGRC